MGWFHDSKEDDDFDDAFRRLHKEVNDKFNKHHQFFEEHEADVSNTFKTWLGVVIGFVVLAIVISVCCACCRRKKRGQIISRGQRPVVQTVPATQPYNVLNVTTVPTQAVTSAPTPFVPNAPMHAMPTAPTRPPSLPPSYDQAVGMYEPTPAYNPNVPR